jgi:hypothetical protein
MVHAIQFRWYTQVNFEEWLGRGCFNPRGRLSISSFMTCGRVLVSAWSAPEESGLANENRIRMTESENSVQEVLSRSALHSSG